MAHTQSLLGTITDVRVESLGGLGDGVATLGGKPLFISKSCIGDLIRARVTHENHEGSTGAIELVLEAGPERILAPCPHFAACGGCTLQQLQPQSYRTFKTRMFQSAVSRAGFEAGGRDVLFLSPPTRRRVEFKTHHANGELRLAFYEARSRNPVDLATCLILRPELEALMRPLQQALQTVSFRHTIRAVSVTLASSGADLLLHVTEAPVKPQAELLALLETLGLARACLRINDTAPFVSATRKAVTMRFGQTDVALPPDAFLQATQEGEDALVQGVLAHIPVQAKTIDLFSGLGTYSFALLTRQAVHAVEMDESMVKSMGQHQGLTAETRDLFKDPVPAYALNNFGAAVINPPRAGAKAQTEAIAASQLSHVVMVSCNPASFTRDAAILKKAGFSMTHAFGLDQFVWSPHLEILAAFAR